MFVIYCILYSVAYLHNTFGDKYTAAVSIADTDRFIGSIV